jgi:DNA polymerase-4
MSSTSLETKPVEVLATIRKIIHVDMDAFYASVEQMDNPDLLGKPVIVGGNPHSRGVVAACSYEARRFHIHSAMPCKQAAQLCPKAVFVTPRMQRYKEVSQRVMQIFRKYTSLVEPLSLDEAFLDVTAHLAPDGSATLLARQICAEIKTTIGLSASAGISFNKFLAKVASDINKPNGITTIAPSQALSFLDCLSIRKFFGVGAVTEKKMHALGIHTGGDLRSWDEQQLIYNFGKTGSFLYRIVRGLDDRPVVPERVRKSIGSETTFAADIVEIKHLQNVLEHLARSVGDSLNTRQLSCSCLTLKVRYNDFKTITRSLTVAVPISSHVALYKHLLRLLDSTEAGIRPIRLLGCSVSKLDSCRSVPRQLKLPFP